MRTTTRPSASRLTRTRPAVLLLGSLALAGLVWPEAQAGVGGGGPLRHKRCLGAEKECVVRVLVGASATGGNSCGVSLPDVVVLGRQVEGITWQLVSMPGAKKHRFIPSARVRLDDNFDTDNEPEIASQGPASFDDQPLAPDATHDRKSLRAAARARAKAYSYSVSLERESAPGQWSPCDVIDPIVIVRGG